jgi:DNA (cytosine-5)-methyltransferase 1
MKKTYNVVDMFCGAGGESTGITLAAGEQNMRVNLTAINHWERAIETHAANHPGAEHLCESVERIDPARAVPGQRLDLLWASPECTHHSNARGGRPRSDQGRASAWLILKWLSELFVKRVIIENVPEFLSWGPLDSGGKPLQNRKGETFRAFIGALRSLGYEVDWRILTAADYGDPTIRRRLFIQAVKGRKRILWPEITHMEKTDNLIGYAPWRSAREIIDWSIPGTSIFGRKRPLAEATIRRIAVGIDRYWKEEAKPFLAVLYGTSDVRSLERPFPTVTTCGSHHALVHEPFTKCGLDIRFRMLKNHELKKAQGFPENYVITGNITEQTKQIGNAVPVNTAKALARAIMTESKE